MQSFNSADVRHSADEVAMLMATRLGGVRRGESYDLTTMIRRRGGALPPKLLKQARILERAYISTGSPRISRQMDYSDASRAYTELTSYLRPFGRVTRVQERATNIAASFVFGLMLLGLVILWILIWRGLV